MAQSGDAPAMSRGRYPVDSAQPTLQATRRSSNSSTQSTHTAGMTINLNSDDGHTPTAKYRRDLRDSDERDGNPMGGMDVLAESARRVSEEEGHRRGSMTMDEREDSPKAGGPGGPKYQCAYCSKTFSRPSSLRIHTYSRESDPRQIIAKPRADRQTPVNDRSSVRNHLAVVDSQSNPI